MLNLDGVAFLVGLLFGALLTFVGWRGDAKSAAALKPDPRKDPRIVAAAYGLGGLFVTTMTDWGRILPAAQKNAIPVSQMPWYYVEGFALAMLVVICFYVVLVYKNTSARASSSQTDYTPSRSVLDFLSWGYAYYAARLDSAERDAKQARLEAEIKGLQEDAQRMRQANNAGAVYMAGILTRVKEYLDNPTPTQKIDLCERILDAMTIMSKPFLSDGSDPKFDTNANYMLAVPLHRATDAEKNSVRFLDGPIDDCSHLLVLKEYAKNTQWAPHPFALPVPKRFGKWKEKVLPGAPDAFLHKNPIAVGHPTPFGPSVPNHIRLEITEYLQAQRFQCFVSLIIPYKGDPIGIVNIESSNNAILKKDDKKQVLREMEDILQPYCALLALLLV